MSMVDHSFLENKQKNLLYVELFRSGLVCFYGISTIGGYLMPNPIFTYILDI